MLSKKATRFLSRLLLLVPVICLFAGCRGVEAKKVQEPSPSLELQLEATKRALALKEEDNASLMRQLEAARQARQREQEELGKQFDEARALLEERITTLSGQLSSETNATRKEKDQRREVKARLVDAEDRLAAAVRELQDMKEVLALREREAADLAKQVEAAKRMVPAKEPQHTKTQEPARTVTDRQPLLDKLSGIAPWVWIASAVVVVMLLYLVVRQSILSKGR
jgi:chromosome segregation ATPase